MDCDEIIKRAVEGIAPPSTTAGIMHGKVTFFAALKMSKAKSWEADYLDQVIDRLDSVHSPNGKRSRADNIVYMLINCQGSPDENRLSVLYCGNSNHIQDSLLGYYINVAASVFLYFWKGIEAIYSAYIRQFSKTDKNFYKFLKNNANGTSISKCNHYTKNKTLTGITRKPITTVPSHAFYKHNYIVLGYWDGDESDLKLAEAATILKARSIYLELQKVRGFDRIQTLYGYTNFIAQCPTGLSSNIEHQVLDDGFFEFPGTGIDYRDVQGFLRKEIASRVLR